MTYYALDERQPGRKQNRKRRASYQNRRLFFEYLESRRVLHGLNAVDDTFSGVEDTPLTLSASALMSNDDLGDEPTSITAFDALTTQGGTVVDNGDSTYTYTPPSAYLGPDTFTYTISDSHPEISTATVTVNVNEAFTDQLVVGGLNAPIGLISLPDGRMLIGEKAGVVKIVDPSDPVPTTQTYLTIPNVETANERGLWDFALDPDFATNNYFYVYYASSETDKVRVSRFEHDTTLPIDAGTETVIWEDPDTYLPITQTCCHYGGGMDFGPDGKLYLTTGDKWKSPADSQDLESAAGKIIRLNSDGTIPGDNPFVDGPGGNLDEIWAYGLRNPFRANWDLPTGRFFIGDVGGNVQETAKEEINLGIAGANYGWNNVEGIVNNPLYEDPIFEYDHSAPTPDGGAIAGGFVYRGTQFPSEYDGAYFFGDYVAGWIRYLKFDTNGDIIDADPGTQAIDPFDFVETPIAPVAIEQGADGALYYNDYIGELHKVEFNNGNLPPVITSATANPTQGDPAPLQVNFAGTATDPESGPLTYTWDFGDGNQATGQNATHDYLAKGYYLATLQVSDGIKTTVSDPIPITVGQAPVIQSISPADGTLFRGGDVLNLSAVVTDDGPLTGANYSWTARFIHNAHTHPEFDNISGETTTLNIPTTGHDFSDMTGFEIELTVTDNDGIPTTEVISVFPDKVDVTFSTNFPGTLTYQLDSIPRVGNFVHDTAIDFQHTISVPDVVYNNGNQFVFSQWSDGTQTSSNTFTVPDSNLLLTAEYTNNGPAQLITNGLVLQLDAQTGVTTSGGQVVSWSDQSGNGNDLNIATGDPQLVAGGLNGLDTIAFDGTDDVLQRTATLTGLPTGASDRSAFVVTKYNGVGDGGVTYGQATQNRAFGLTVSSGGDLKVQAWGGVNDHTSNVAGTGAGWLVQSAVVQSNVLIHYKDGSPIDVRNQVYNTAGAGSFVIGTEIDGTPAVDMEVAEVLIYDRALTDLERQELDAYLWYKYFVSSQTPFAVDDADTTPEDTPITINVMANDVLGNPPTTITSITQGTSGTVTTDGATVTYTPNPDSFGVDTFTYTITDDDSETSTAMVTVTVTENLPVAVDDSDSTLEETLIVIDVLANDTLGDPPTTITSVTQGTNGTVSTDGSTVSYTPNIGFTGTDNFTYTITDSENDTSVANVAVVVAPVGGGAPLNPVLDLQADSGITLNGGFVSQWQDLSGNDNNVSAAGSTQPEYGTVLTPSGKTAVSFDGTDDHLLRTVPEGFTGLPVGNDDRTVFLVAQINDANWHGGAAYGAGVQNETFGVGTIGRGANEGRVFLQGWGTSNDLNANVLTYTPPTGPTTGWTIIAARLVDDGTDPANNAFLYKDGTQVAAWSHQYATNLTNAALLNGGESISRLALGQEIAEKGYVQFDVAAYVVYDSALSMTDMQAVETFLTNKYLSLNNTPVAMDDTDTTHQETPITIDVMANDNLGDLPTTITAVTQGTSGMVTTDGATVTYTPNLGFFGADTFTYTITDNDSETSVANVMVTVNQNNTPVAMDDTDTTHQETPITIDVMANDNLGDPPTTITAVTQGTSGTVTTDGATVTYTPNLGFFGADTFTYTITDNDSETSVANVMVTVTQNNTPVAMDDTDTTHQETPITIDVMANDSLGDPPTTITAVTQGTSGTVTTDGATVTYTPNLGFFGADTFTYTITDNDSETSVANVMVTVTQNNTPVAMDDTDTTHQETPITIDVMANDNLGDPPTTITAVTQGTSGTVTTDGATVTYTPNLGFFGADTFTYTITDNDSETSVANVMVTVTQNNTPVAMDDTDTTHQETPITIDVMANDNLGDPPTTITAVTQGTSGTVTTDGATVTYTPNLGFFGADTFTYTITDNDSETSVANVMVTVTQNNTPVAMDDTDTTGENLLVTIDVMANDNLGDPPTTITAVTQGGSGTVTTDGLTVSYDPNTDFVGVDTFTYTITDNDSETSMAMVTVTVNRVDKIGVYRQDLFYRDLNGNGLWDPATDVVSNFIATTTPIVGDWNGDGTDEIGGHLNNLFYRDLNGNGLWDGSAVDVVSAFGIPGDTPIVGDWNGDGTDEIGVHRGNLFYRDLNGNGLWDGGAIDVVSAFGIPGDTPIVGDWNGDGTDEIGVHRDNLFYRDLNGNGLWDGGAIDGVSAFGIPGDTPIVGDWNGDGTDEIGVHRSGQFYRDVNGNGLWDPASDVVSSFGLGTDTPISGQWAATGGGGGGSQTSRAYQNPDNVYDVDDDGFVAAGDVLEIVSFINTEFSGPLPARPAGEPVLPPFLDPTGDDAVAADDVLLVVASLNDLIDAIAHAESEDTDRAARALAVASVSDPAAATSGTASISGDLAGATEVLAELPAPGAAVPSDGMSSTSDAATAPLESAYGPQLADDLLSDLTSQESGAEALIDKAICEVVQTGL